MARALKRDITSFTTTVEGQMRKQDKILMNMQADLSAMKSQVEFALKTADETKSLVESLRETCAAQAATIAELRKLSDERHEELKKAVAEHDDDLDDFSVRLEKIDNLLPKK